MGFRKDFLWGGATAANQYEGGWNVGRRGKSSDDVITNGTHTEPHVSHRAPIPHIGSEDSQPH